MGSTATGTLGGGSGAGFIASLGGRCYPYQWSGLAKSGQCGPCGLRVDVLLVDKLRTEPEYVAKWHLFLPSDVLPGRELF